MSKENVLHETLSDLKAMKNYWKHNKDFVKAINVAIDKLSLETTIEKD